MNNRFILLSIILFVSFSLFSCGGDDDGGTTPTGTVYDGNWSMVYDYEFYDPIGGGVLNKTLESKLNMNIDNFSLNVYDEENILLRSESGTFAISADTIRFTVNPGEANARVHTMKHDVMSKIKIYFSVIHQGSPKIGSGPSGFLWGGTVQGHAEMFMIEAGLFGK